MPASNSPTLAGGKVQALYPATHQSVAYTGTAGTIANAISGVVVRVLCTTNAFVKIGTSPTATTADMLVMANTAEYFRARAGDKVSAIQSAAGGTLHVTEMD